MLTGRFLVLCGGSLAYFLALGSTWPVIPAFVEHDLGGGGLAVGLSVGAFGFSAAVLRPLVGPLGDRRGRRFLLVGGALVVSLSMLLLVPAASVPAVIGARLVLGVGEAAYFIGVTSAVQDLTPPHRRGEATSYFTVTLYTGLAIGPGLGEWLYETGSYERAFTVAALLGLVPLLFAYAAPGRPTDPVRAPLLRWRLHPAAIRPGTVLLPGPARLLGLPCVHRVACRECRDLIQRPGVCPVRSHRRRCSAAGRTDSGPTGFARHDPVVAGFQRNGPRRVRALADGHRRLRRSGRHGPGAVFSVPRPFRADGGPGAGVRAKPRHRVVQRCLRSGGRAGRLPGRRRGGPHRPVRRIPVRLAGGRRLPSGYRATPWWDRSDGPVGDRLTPRGLMAGSLVGPPRQRSRRAVRIAQAAVLPDSYDQY